MPDDQSKTFLTKFITLFELAADKLHFLRHVNTNYPNGQTLRLQERDHVLGMLVDVSDDDQEPVGFGLRYFDEKATVRASMLWSFEGRSTDNATRALCRSYDELEYQGKTGIKVFGEEERPGSKRMEPDKK